MVTLKRGKLYSIMGYARLKLCQYEEGYKHLLDALDCYGGCLSNSIVCDWSKKHPFLTNHKQRKSKIVDRCKVSIKYRLITFTQSQSEPTAGFVFILLSFHVFEKKYGRRYIELPQRCRRVSFVFIRILYGK